MSAFALYKMPHSGSCTLLSQISKTPLRLQSFRHLGGQQGFVFAPFAISNSTPLLVIEPEKAETFPVSALPDVPDDSFSFLKEPSLPREERASYTEDFAKFHDKVVTGALKKIVLSRSSLVRLNKPSQPMAWFKAACARYPSQFVALVSTPASGTWMMATPEVLLECQDNLCHTMALAGTIPAPKAANYPIDEGKLWSKKNQIEQQLVAYYIGDKLSAFSDSVQAVGPKTVKAGDLLHLCTDFKVSLPLKTNLGSVIEALHPTPAVCGLPKEKALNFIQNNEHSPRNYYAGFAGPMAFHGMTRLFVSLRCMQIFPKSCLLYAGGGLLADSKEASEWAETEAKMGTMRHLLG